MIKLRPVTMGDARQLLKWKNEADTRKNSIVTDRMIAWKAHYKWLKATLKDEAVDFKIIMVDGKASGDVRLNYHNGETEISIRMDKKFRGRGLATQVIALFKGPLTAKIRAHNLASMRVFIANGYRPEEYTEKPVPYYIFRK